MAFPSVVQEIKKEQASDSASHVCWDNSSPATPGNTLVCFFGTDCNTADSQYVTIAISTGVGWELIRQDGNGNFNLKSAFLIKRNAAGDSSDNLTLSTSGTTSAQQSSNICVELSGTNNYAISFLGSTGGSNPNPPAVTGLHGTQDNLIYIYRAGDNTVVPSAAPTNYGNLNNQAATNATGCSSSVMRRQLNGTGDDPGQMTCASEQYCLYVVAFSPILNVYATVAQTITKAAQAASGTETISGTIAQTITKAAQAAAGTETISGTIAQTIIKAEQAASGTETISGAIAQTITKAGQAAAGTETISGTVAQTITKTEQAASGTETISGAIAQTITKAEQSAVGAEAISGTIAQTAPKAGQAASGIETIAGTVAQTITKVGQAISAVETISSTIAQIAPVASQSATGQVGADLDVDVKAVAFVARGAIKKISGVPLNSAQKIIGVNNVPV